jgi:hypothetical protein
MHAKRMHRKQKVGMFGMRCARYRYTAIRFGPDSRARSHRRDDEHADVLGCLVKWIVRSVLVAATAYVLLSGAVAAAMLQSPERFGRIMRYTPAPLVWGVLPGSRLWLWARQGDLREGTVAPDFTLWTQDHSSHVTLSSFRGKRPVVLVFGSYT